MHLTQCAQMSFKKKKKSRSHIKRAFSFALNASGRQPRDVWSLTHGHELMHSFALNRHRNTFKRRPPGPLRARKMRMLRTAAILDWPRITIINSSWNLIVAIRSTHQLGNYVSRWGASSIINATFAKAYWPGEKRLFGLSTELLLRSNNVEKSGLLFINNCIHWMRVLLFFLFAVVYTKRSDMHISKEKLLLCDSDFATCWSGSTHLFALQLAMHAFYTHFIFKFKTSTLKSKYLQCTKK